jgi:hypothetical protein
VPGRALGFLRAAMAVMVAMPVVVSEVGSTELEGIASEQTLGERGCS